MLYLDFKIYGKDFIKINFLKDKNKSIAISRVLSRMLIYLVLFLQTKSSEGLK